MKIRFLVFLLGVFFLFSVNAQMVSMYGGASGGVAVPSMPQVGGVKIPTYEKPALPPTQEELDAQKEEEVEEDETKQMIKGAAISAGVMIGANAIVKGFSTKANKNSCLGRNTYKEFHLVGDTQWFYIWDTDLSFKKSEVDRCLTCCKPSADKKKNDGVYTEKVRLEKLDECKKECSDDNEDCIIKCDDEFSVFNTTGCSTTGKCKNAKSLYNSQMGKYCTGDRGCLSKRTD
ncbi:MAG: hypothetical protein ACTSXV_02010 [Alphaproteobacteria bacterium]